MVRSQSPASLKFGLQWGRVRAGAEIGPIRWESVAAGRVRALRRHCELIRNFHHAAKLLEVLARGGALGVAPIGNRLYRRLATGRLTSMPRSCRLPIGESFRADSRGKEGGDCTLRSLSLHCIPVG